MAITAAQVKELRDKTGAGMMDAKKALTETGGDMEAAIDWLRTKGLAKAAKKSGRTAAEGLVAVAHGDGRAVAVEVNSETDFVAKNEEFQKMVGAIAEAALGAADLEELKKKDLGGKTVEETITEAVAKIGENMTLRRMAVLEGDTVVSYVHNAVAPNMGKIAVLVALKGEDNGIGRQIAMHIAAANPASLSAEDLDPALLERERAVLTEQARESGKPEPVIEKMVEGRMKKFLSEVTLLGQQFVVNPDQTVAEAAKDAGVEITGFRRLEVGEGIEKREEDFAAEVAKAVQG
ncbi:elongation factor Ts [Meinhardsimonia xiamenensis]|jgi:elongation factor Ts|uniref:Elongation factor Ts n=1 Tax=Meinhardsimonia xiamenensis TaxID=990712 RepID=A0A1G9FQ86_9RHOB|nr:translation elongation factor Ts [Meinhardsimonia xiamenensis]PRX37736.1 elongation factor Ts [Meinhardsimonia xiamenensis]SDK90560.1 elongation factor Ts [Meinhardsimonia xiamenensis]